MPQFKCSAKQIIKSPHMNHDSTKDLKNGSFAHRSLMKSLLKTVKKINF